MAECVGCGKEIEQGKLFCDQCYAKMKGRRGPMRERVAPSPHTGAEKRAAEGEGLRGEGAPPQETGIPVEGVTAAEDRERRRASDVLTPTTHKKVVRLHPEVDKGRGKEGRGEKRFAVTITLSERAYRLLSRLGRGAAKEGAGEESAESGEARHPGARRRTGPHGRPALRAVAGKGAGRSEKAAQGAGFLGWIARRERARDRGDLVSLALAALATVLAVTLPFANWVRMSWLEENGTPLEEVNIRGTQLGATTYVLIALAVAAALYFLAASLLGDRLSRLDYGFVYLLLGVAFIAVFYAGISSNQRMVNIALRLLQERGVTGYAGIPPSRSTLFAAYLMLLNGLFMSFSGLIRLSERR